MQVGSAKASGAKPAPSANAPTVRFEHALPPRAPLGTPGIAFRVSAFLLPGDLARLCVAGRWFHKLAEKAASGREELSRSLTSAVRHAESQDAGNALLAVRCAHRLANGDETVLKQLMTQVIFGMPRERLSRLAGTMSGTCVNDAGEGNTIVSELIDCLRVGGQLLAGTHAVLAAELGACSRVFDSMREMSQRLMGLDLEAGADKGQPTTDALELVESAFDLRFEENGTVSVTDGWAPDVLQAEMGEQVRILLGRPAEDRQVTWDFNAFIAGVPGGLHGETVTVRDVQRKADRPLTEGELDLLAPRHSDLRMRLFVLISNAQALMLQAARSPSTPVTPDGELHGELTDGSESLSIELRKEGNHDVRVAIDRRIDDAQSFVPCGSAESLALADDEESPNHAHFRCTVTLKSESDAETTVRLWVDYRAALSAQ